MKKQNYKQLQNCRDDNELLIYYNKRQENNITTNDTKTPKNKNELKQKQAVA